MAAVGTALATLVAAIFAGLATLFAAVASSKIVQYLVIGLVAVMIGKMVLSTAGTTLVEASDHTFHAIGNVGETPAYAIVGYHRVLGIDVCFDPYIRFGPRCRVSPEKMRKFETASRPATDGSTTSGPTGFVCPMFGEMPTTALINETQACKYLGPVIGAPVPLGFKAEYDDAGTPREATAGVTIITGNATFRPKE